MAAAPSTPENPGPPVELPTSTSSTTSNASSTTQQHSMQPWRDEMARVSPTLAELKSAMRIAVRQNTPAPTLRVNQLDAIILDNELYEMLRSQFLRVFIHFRADFVDTWKPELEAFLRALIFQISIGTRNFSYGQQLQNLTFGPLSKRKKVLFFLFSVGVPYLLQRWFSLYRFFKTKFSVEGEDVPQSPEPSTLRRIHTLEKLYQLLSTLNFLLFLWNGAYVSLLHRILGIQQSYIKRSMSRRIGFEYMNRQLIWNGFTEFMLFIMPMVPVTRIARTAKRIGNAVVKKLGIPTSGASSRTNFNDDMCPICESTINIPYVSNCGHKYCYYCIKVAVMTESKPPCNVCGAGISSIHRHQPNST